MGALFSSAHSRLTNSSSPRNTHSVRLQILFHHLFRSITPSDTTSVPFVPWPPFSGQFITLRSSFLFCFSSIRHVVNHPSHPTFFLCSHPRPYSSTSLTLPLSPNPIRSHPKRTGVARPSRRALARETPREHGEDEGGVGEGIVGGELDCCG